MVPFSFKSWVITVAFSIVFVHGLRGHREKTWTKNEVMWPKDLLAADIEQSRIMSYGHDSGVVHSDTAEITQGSLANAARNLCSLLSVERSTPETVSSRSLTSSRQVKNKCFDIHIGQTSSYICGTQPWWPCLCNCSRSRRAECNRG